MKKIIIVLGIIVVSVIAILILKPTHSQVSQKAAPSSESDSPKIVSTKPAPLEDTIIGAADSIEISFNRPLENKGEFKVRIEPKIDFTVELSSDRKTARIIPVKSLELGAAYTLFIGTDTKFDGVGAWGQEKIYHFKTIKYTGV